MLSTLWNDPALRIMLEQAEDNLRILEVISRYLNFTPKAIRKEQMNELSESCGLSEEENYRLLLAAYCGLNGEESINDKRLERMYFPHIVHSLSAKKCKEDPYYRLIHFPEAKKGRWRFGYKRIEAYETFASDDLLIMPDGREIPQVGYFSEAFETPAVFQDGREWMTVTPSEQNTMMADVNAVSGKVAVFGLGLGYYPLLISEMPQVKEIVIVELDADVISLFRKYLFPQFSHAEKIKIVQADAFAYAESMKDEQFDYAYVDIWHDVLDGTRMYLQMKRLEEKLPHTRFLYWIEKSILCWLRGMALQEVQDREAGPMLQTIGVPKNAQQLKNIISNQSIAGIASKIPLSVTEL